MTHIPTIVKSISDLQFFNYCGLLSPAGLIYDDCLDIRWKIIRTVLCCIMQHNCAQSYARWYQQFL